jgi:hypothetical protein
MILVTGIVLIDLAQELVETLVELGEELVE